MTLIVDKNRMINYEVYGNQDETHMSILMAEEALLSGWLVTMR